MESQYSVSEGIQCACSNWVAATERSSGQKMNGAEIGFFHNEVQKWEHFNGQDIYKLCFKCLL